MFEATHLAQIKTNRLNDIVEYQYERKAMSSYTD